MGYVYHGWLISVGITILCAYNVFLLFLLLQLMLTTSFYELRRVEDEMAKVSKEKTPDSDEGLGEEEPLLTSSRQC